MKIFKKIIVFIILIILFVLNFNTYAELSDVIKLEGQLNDGSNVKIIEKHNENYFYVIEKYNEDENCIKTVENTIDSRENMIQFVSTSDNGFILISEMFEDIMNSDKGGIILAKYNQECELEKRKEVISWNDMGQRVYIEKLKINENGNYELVGMSKDNEENVVLEFDKEFNRVEVPEKEEEDNNKEEQEIENKITKEKLKESMQKVLDMGEDGDIKIKEGENSFILYNDEYSFELKYDLSQKNPKFYTEAIIEKGMSYDEYSLEMTQSMILIYAYAAVADIKGVDIETAVEYMMLLMFDGVLEEFSTKDNNYMIVSDNYQIQEGEDKKIIKKSEFGDRVIEYVDETFKNDIVEDELKTFDMTAKKENTSETSRKIVVEMVVNMDSDFSKIEEFIKKKEEEWESEWEDDWDDDWDDEPEEEKKPEIEISKIPYAGLEFSKVAYVVSINIVALIIVLFIVILKGERKKNKK